MAFVYLILFENDCKDPWHAKIGHFDGFKFLCETTGQQLSPMHHPAPTSLYRFYHCSLFTMHVCTNSGRKVVSLFKKVPKIETWTLCVLDDIKDLLLPFLG